MVAVRVRAPSLELERPPFVNVADITDAFEALSARPCDLAEAPFLLAAATGVPASSVSRLRSGNLNRSKLAGGVLLNSKFHYAPADPGETLAALDRICAAPESTARKVRIAVTCDGDQVAARDLKTGDAIHSTWAELKDHFGFFFPLAGIERFKAADENPVDIKATAKLSRLYDTLIKANPAWATAERRHDMNQFMTRVIFCLFAEDTGILDDNLFSKTVAEHGGVDGENVRNALLTAFRSMAMRDGRDALPAWARAFPYVNGGLFSSTVDAPVFTRTAFNYLREAGSLDWGDINPDIFGSMIQSIADPKMRGELGMHYTSVPNIMKVIGPLFLDDLDEALGKAWDRPNALRRLLGRLARIRVFDPACGSGNFLVVSYRELRAREAKIVSRLSELEAGGQVPMFSAIPLANFFGIEIEDFAAETAKLSLLIAEYQANKRHEAAFGARAPSLPLAGGARITTGNALRLDWEAVCPPPDLTDEVFIAGNPPFLGKSEQTSAQKLDVDFVFRDLSGNYRSLDFVSGWFHSAAKYISGRAARAALVATSSVCQGVSTERLWSQILSNKVTIFFAHRPFKWANSAKENAAVSCVIVGISSPVKMARIFEGESTKNVMHINPYLIDFRELYIRQSTLPIFSVPKMELGNMPYDNGGLSFTPAERQDILADYPESLPLFRRYVCTRELVHGVVRYCLHATRRQLDRVTSIPPLKARIDSVQKFREASCKPATKKMSIYPHVFSEVRTNGEMPCVLVPRTVSERREYWTSDFFDAGVIPGDIYYFEAPRPWPVSINSSRLHLIWIATVCGKLESRFRYSNTLGWNTFPVPDLSDADKAMLDQCARDILTTRAEHHPKTLAQLYDPDKMPDDLREAHRRNDAALESLYLSRPFRNDTERLEHLFERYAARIEELKKEA